MAKRKPEPALTHTGLLCLAARALEGDIRKWAEACADSPDGEEMLQHICAVPIRQLEAIRQMYYLETGEEM